MSHLSKIVQEKPLDRVRHFVDRFDDHIVEYKRESIKKYLEEDKGFYKLFLINGIIFDRLVILNSL